MKIFLFGILCLFLLASPAAKANDIDFDNLEPSDELVYTLRLAGGDMLTGRIIEIIEEGNDSHLRFKTDIGTATVYKSQIMEIRFKERYYRHAHRVFLMPTAEPISDNHFIGLYELFLGYGGIGLTDYISITGGRTLLPSIEGGSIDRATLFNVKLTPYRIPNNDMEGAIHFGVGMNVAMLGGNSFWHLYTNATFVRERSRITGLIYYKAAGPDLFAVNVGKFGAFNANYSTGTIGIGVGLDTRFSNRHDLHFIGELWNTDLTRPYNTAIMAGLRIANSDVAADFGLMFFTQPFVVPVVSFTFTPFFNSDFR